MKKGLIFVLFFSITNLYSENTINFYLNEKPMQINKWLKIDNNISTKKEFLNPSLSGFLALYSGYMDYSNPDGQVSFPLRHENNKVYLIITPSIRLITVKGNTISHKEFDESVKDKTEIYLFEKKEDQNKQFFWQVKKEDYPEDKIISPLSVVILTDPKNLYITTGDFMATENKQMVLPKNIFVITNNQSRKILLNFMNMEKYFEPIDIKDKKINKTLFQKIMTNN
jgi:hypothetical protein